MPSSSFTIDQKADIDALLTRASVQFDKGLGLSDIDRLISRLIWRRVSKKTRLTSLKK